MYHLRGSIILFSEYLFHGIEMVMRKAVSMTQHNLFHTSESMLISIP